MPKQKTESLETDKTKSQSSKSQDLNGNHSHFSFFSTKVLIIIFIIIEIAIIVFMYPDYRITKNHTLARKYAQTGEFEKSKKHYLVLKNIYPESETINFELGNVLLAMKDYAGALECYGIVLSIQKDPSAALLKQVGLCYVNTGYKEEALRFFEGAVKKNPNDPDANFYLGESKILNKEYTEAAKYFQRIPNPEAYGEKLTDYWKEIEKAVLGDLATEVTK